jgi:hypothetical protein
MMGSAIFVSIAILHIRKRAFERTIEDLALRRRRKMSLTRRSFTRSLSRRRNSASGGGEGAIISGAVRGGAIKDEPEKPTAHPASDHDDQENGRDKSANANEGSPPPGSSHIRFESNIRSSKEDVNPSRVIYRTRSRIFTGSGVGVRGMENHPRNAPPVYRVDDDDDKNNVSDNENRVLRGSMAKIDRWIVDKGGFIGRNSQFHNLSEKDRKRLGGIEYDAVCLLSWVVPVYFVLWQLLGAIGVGAWLQINRPATALTNGKHISPLHLPLY